MRPIECKCFDPGCGFGMPFIVYVPPEVENRLSGPPYLHDCGEAENGGTYTCHNGHISDELCVMEAGSDRINDLPLGTWSV